jgi:hypothetical protein
MAQVRELKAEAQSRSALIQQYVRSGLDGKRWLTGARNARGALWRPTIHRMVADIGSSAAKASTPSKAKLKKTDPAALMYVLAGTWL